MGLWEYVLSKQILLILMINFIYLYDSKGICMKMNNNFSSICILGKSSISLAQIPQNLKLFQILVPVSVFVWISQTFVSLVYNALHSEQINRERWYVMILYKLQIITLYLFIEQMAYSNIQFCDLEISILTKLVPESKYLQIKKFGEIAEKFNQELLKEGIPGKRSGRTLRTQLAAMYGKQRISWSAEMEKRMLDGVMQGKKWAKIAKEELFSTNEINGTKIKQKFQSDMRLKLRAFVRIFGFQEFHDSNSSLFASDLTFKFILNGQSNKKIRDNFCSAEISTILKSRPFFIQSLYETNGEKKKIRRLQVLKDLTKVFDDYREEAHSIAQLLVKLSKLLGKHSETKQKSRNPLNLALSHKFQQFFGPGSLADQQHRTEISPKRTQKTLQKKNSINSSETRESDIFESFSNGDFLKPELDWFDSQINDLL